MKRKWLGLALATAMACAGAATQSAADVLAEDSAANYTAETFVSGANLGSGFGAWEFWNAAPTLADSAAGLCGDINSENGVSFRFARDGIDGEPHYGYCNGYRGFNALNPGDVLTFKFTCAYCAGNRGLDLFANGGHSDDDKIANVINLSGDNEYSVNGVVITNNWAPQAISEVTVSQLEDGIQIAIKRTSVSTDPVVEPMEYTTKVETDKKLTGIGLYAGGWDWNDGADVENYAFYVNDLKIEGTPPADRLTVKGEWAVTQKTQKIGFTVNRENPEGDLVVSLASSYPAFAKVPETVTILDGEWAAEFTVNATVQGNENTATISATAEGVAGGSFDVKGPKYTCVAWEEGVEHPEVLAEGGTRDFYINNCWKEGWAEANNNAIMIQSTDQSVVKIDSIGDWQEDERGSYSKCKIAAIGPGEATIEVHFGSKMCEYTFYVKEAGATLSGPTSIRVGVPTTYTLDVTLPTGLTDSVGLGASGESKVVIDPDMAQDIDASTSLKFTVTALNAGTFTLTPYDTEGLSFNELEITVSEAPVYDDYIAYDDATLYPDGFDTASTGVGQNGFEAWSVYQAEAENGGVFVGDSVPESLSGILEDGKVLGLYANGSWENNNYKMYRGFGGDLGLGQEFAIDFACTATGGSRFVQVVRMWEGTGYPRFEVYTSDGYVGVNLEGFEGGDIGWAPADRVVHLSVLRTADGSAYTLSLTSGSDSWSKDIPASTENWGDGLQGFIVGAWNSGSDLYFNRMSIEQVEEPVVVRAIDWAYGVWNPDAAGDYDFAISATTEDIGEVALSVEPSDGALSLSTDTVDLTGKTLAPFTVTLSEANEGDHFVIKATPVDTTVAPIEYNVTVVSSHVTLSSDAWEYPVSAGEIWLGLSASVSKYGTYAITSSDEAVLAVPEASEAIAVGSPDPSWFNVTIVGPGQATIYATAEGEETPAAEYTFTVIADAPSIDGTTIEVSFADGDGLSGKVDDTLRDQFTNVKAQVLQWNGEAKAFVEVEVLENEADPGWPNMKFTPSIDNPVIRLIFEKK